jgi:N-acetylmuramoyl-L-alanine amidase
MKYLKKKKKAKVQKFNIRYIVVHMTGTKPGVAIKELDKLPYHYLITQGGRLINVKPLQPLDGTIEVALSGGLDKKGKHVDTRTELQEETLFNTLVMLTEAYPEATIMGADEVYPYGFANPGFDIKSWLNNYIPAFLQAA